MKLLRLALKIAWREWRAGELTLLIAAVVIAVASITAVGMFTDRLERAMAGQAAELLGADLVLSSPKPIPAERRQKIRQAGLTSADTLTLRSVVLRGEDLQLVEAKAVSASYPLRGRVNVAPSPFVEGTITSDIPAPGSAWADPRLAAALDLAVGDTVTLGELTVRISAIITYEPDRAGDFFSIAPRLMFNLQDVARTGLVQPGSRVTHRLLVSGDFDSVRAFRAEIAPALPSTERIQGVEDARPEMRIAQSRARQFLGLASLAAVLLAGVSVALSARRYALRHLDTAGLLRCLGCSRAAVIKMFVLQILVIGSFAGIVGVLLGFAAQAALVDLLASLFIGGLPAPSSASAVMGVGFGLIILIGFGLPPLLKLGRVPPARVLRQDDGGFSGRNTLAYSLALVTAVGLALWFASDVRIALYVLGGMSLGGAALALAAYLMVSALQGLRTQVGVAWRFGLANLARRKGASAVQVVSFGLGLMVLLLLGVVRTDLLDAWSDNLPADAPNYFLVNVQPHEADGVRQMLRTQGVQQAATYPMIRGRFVYHNAKPVEAQNYPEGRARRLATREFNLSHDQNLPPGNTIIDGSWWSEETDSDQWSVEAGIAQTLGIKLGDTVVFRIAGSDVTGKVGSIRKLKWESFNVNFFVLGTPAQLLERPATYISSFHLPADKRHVLSDLVRQYPSVTVIDVDALLEKIRTLIDQATRGVEFVFLFTMLAGLSVLAATVHATLDERRYESALIRTLGGSRARVWQSLGAEFLALGSVAGVLAAAGATVIGSVLASQVFQLPYTGSVWIWVFGVPAGALGIGLTGLLGTRKVVSHPPITTLRGGS
jgi:putative ABC transport system permease protein